MEILLSFLGGVVLVALIAFFVARSIVKSRVAQAGEAAKLQAEAALKAEQARLESDLEHSASRIEELSAKLQETKDEAARQLDEAKSEADRQLKEAKGEAERQLREAKSEAEKQLQTVKAEAAATLEKAKAEADALLQQTKSEAAKTLEETKEEAAKQLEETKTESAKQLQQTKAEAAKTLEETKAEIGKQKAEELATRDKAHKEAMDALQARFDETIAKVSAQMKSETSQMLKDRQKEFSETSNQSIGQIVNPLKENIAELKKAMEEGNKEQAERNGEMRERIKSLMEHSDAARKSADELAAAFKHGSKVQGDWGETILEELLSSQGLTKGVHFETQAVIRDSSGKPVKNADGGIMRPDVILHLDERREVIIDSKVSLTAYVDYVNAENEADRQSCLKAHLESIRKHVKELAAKDYSNYVQPPKVSAGCVIMFVPNMGALWTALNAEPDLWRRAADQNVYIADEQSLYAALKIVRLTWTQVAQAQNHEKVYELANEMIDRVGIFMERYEALGKALNKASEEYEDGKKKLVPGGQSIINTSGKLIKLGAKNSDKHPIKALQDIDEIPSLPEWSTAGSGDKGTAGSIGESSGSSYLGSGETDIPTE